MPLSENSSAIKDLLRDGFDRIDARFFSLEERMDGRFDILQNSIIDHGNRIAGIETHCKNEVQQNEKRDGKISLLTDRLENHAVGNLTNEIKIKTAWKTLTIILSAIIAGSAFFLSVIKYFR